MSSAFTFSFSFWKGHFSFLFGRGIFLYIKKQLKYVVEIGFSENI